VDEKVNWSCREFPFGSHDYRASLSLREAVLRVPLGLPLRPEDVAGENSAFHLGCFQERTLVGSLVLQPIDETIIKLRQLAVAAETQGKGAGSDLLQFAENFAREKGYNTIVAHARQQVLQFYIKRGYAVRGCPFIEATIPHYAIFKQLQLLADPTGRTSSGHSCPPPSHPKKRPGSDST
jgi:predicted GNAT family N-acyltransferase